MSKYEFQIVSSSLENLLYTSGSLIVIAMQYSMGWIEAFVFITCCSSRGGFYDDKEELNFRQIIAVLSAKYDTAGR